MYQTINFSQFCDSFSDTYKNNFSYEAKKALFDYFEELEEVDGIVTELDPIALCCEWTEYDNLDEVKAQYSRIESLEDLQNHTQVIEIPAGHNLDGTVNGGGLLVMEF
jgi:hypothetical protein